MRPEGFPKEERVRRSEDFTRILEDGTCLRGRWVTAYWVRDPERPDAPNRAGIAAGKRLGKAVLRNRLKRHLREAYRRNKRELPCRGVSIIFLASRGMIGRSWEDVRTDVADLLRRIAASTASSSSP